jgi:Predicted ATPase (AAA+ superfamily)
MNKMRNPFLIKGYISKDYFCDREDELKELTRNAENGLDTTLISPRRMGKTGLIFRFFEYINDHKLEFNAIYVDIFATRSLEDFVRQLAEAILKHYPEKTGFGKNFMKFLKNLRPLISYNPISGEPQVQINYQTPQEKEYTVSELLQFLDNQNLQILIAIDEFQQIKEYPEKNVEALLRTCIQQLKNIRFIFCGSNHSMMLEIFSNAKRPFFGATHYLFLEKIQNEQYAQFIVEQFANHKMKIENEAVEFILDWTYTHTFYTQSLCNIVFSLGIKNITINEVKMACLQIIKQNEPIFLQYRQLLTPAQWNFLIALAKEEKIKQITAQDFIAKYQIGTPANAKRISQALIDKDLIFTSSKKKETTYQVYDVFLLRWLQSTY